MTLQVCPFHADEGVHGTPLHDEAGTEVFECRRQGHPRPGSWAWSFVPAPPSTTAATGLAAELGLHTELTAAIASYGGRWVEYGLVERAMPSLSQPIFTAWLRSTDTAIVRSRSTPLRPTWHARLAS